MPGQGLCYIMRYYGELYIVLLEVPLNTTHVQTSNGQVIHSNQNPGHKTGLKNCAGFSS